MAGNPGAGDRAMEHEALKQIGNMLQMINSQFMEDRKTLTDIRDRVIAIESNRLEGEVKALSERLDRMAVKIEQLEISEIKRNSQIGVLAWLSEKMPWIFGIVVAALAVLGWGKVLGK